MLFGTCLLTDSETIEGIGHHFGTDGHFSIGNQIWISPPTALGQGLGLPRATIARNGKTATALTGKTTAGV